MPRTMSVSDSIVIAASPQELYARVSDPTVMGNWSPENCGAVVDGGGPGARGAVVGMSFVGRNRRGRATWVTRCTVTAADPGRQFAFRVHQIGVRKPRLNASIATWEYRFEAEPSGGTRVVETWTDGRRHWPDALAAVFDRAATGGSLFADFQRRNIATTLARLRAAVESDDTVGAMSSASDQTELLHSPLHDSHVALGATMAPFGGWEMPIQYQGGGVIAEHTAVREAVGIFDVSHLGKATVTGPGAAAFVNATLSADLRKIGPGQAQYTLCCNGNGGVIDDLIAYLVSEDEVFLVPNAANTAKVVTALQGVAPDGIQVIDRHREYGVIAVQGPQAAAVLTAVGLPTELGYMSWQDATYDGLPVRVCRTGYTGEQGYELLPAWDVARPLWDALLAAAAPLGGRAAGLGARDTLRTEMGYPLHGQDLSTEITPVQARAGWAVGWKKDAFFGRDALVAEKAAGPTRTLRGLVALDRGIPRAHQQVKSADGRALGEITSGTHSPTLGKGIALALIDTAAGVQDGDELVVDVRGRPLRVQVQAPPFVESHVR